MLKGKITIGSVHCRDREDYVGISLEDESSGIHFLEVEIDYEKFAQALTGLGYVPVKFELRGTEVVGKKREVKTMVIRIPVPKDGMISDSGIHTAVLVHEVDGWMGCDEDAKNHHNFVKIESTLGKVDFHVYRVGYHRYV